MVFSHKQRRLGIQALTEEVWHLYHAQGEALPSHLHSIQVCLDCLERPNCPTLHPGLVNTADWHQQAGREVQTNTEGLLKFLELRKGD